MFDLTQVLVLFSRYLSIILTIAAAGSEGSPDSVITKEEDIPTLVKALCYGDGRPGSISGFVTLTEEDCTKIYRLML